MLLLLLVLFVGNTNKLRNDPEVIVNRVEINTYLNGPDNSIRLTQIILYRWGRWRGGKVGYGVANFAVLNGRQVSVYRDGEYCELSWRGYDPETRYRVRVLASALRYTETYTDPEQDNLRMVSLNDRDSYFPTTTIGSL